MVLLARAGAVVCALAAAILAVYAAVAVYAGATFDADSLPGAAVLYIVAVGVALAAALCAGLAHGLWRWGRRLP